MPISTVSLSSLTPQTARKLLKDPAVRKRLQSAGIQIRIFELHAPAINAKRTFGYGVTLCGRSKGMRNSYITCKRCMSKLKDLKQGKYMNVTVEQLRLGLKNGSMLVKERSLQPSDQIWQCACCGEFPEYSTRVSSKTAGWHRICDQCLSLSTS